MPVQNVFSKLRSTSNQLTVRDVRRSALQSPTSARPSFDDVISGEAREPFQLFDMTMSISQWSKLTPTGTATATPASYEQCRVCPSSLQVIIIV